MSIQSRLWKSRLWSKRWPIYLRLPIALCTGLAVCVGVAVAVVRTENLPQIVEPPASLLPGNLLPQSIPCTSSFERRFECKASQDGEIIYFTTDSSSHLIVYTSISARNQTLGNMIAAWGAPTGFARFGYALFVYWNMRWVYVSSCKLEPASPIEYIGYGLAGSIAAEREQLPWRGFTGEACDDHIDAVNRP